MRIWTENLAKVAQDVFVVAKNAFEQKPTFFIAGTDDRWFRVFSHRYVERTSPPLAAKLPIAASYCGILYRGKSPILVIEDTSLDPRVMSLEVTKAADIGAYIGAKIEVEGVGSFGTVCAYYQTPHVFSSEETETLAALARILGFTVGGEYRAVTDPLTGLFNRMFLDECEKDEHFWDGDNATLILMDIDDFKKVNDVHGHLGGDRVLRLFAQTMSDVFHEDDHLIRLGGDEFCVISRDSKEALQASTLS